MVNSKNVETLHAKIIEFLQSPKIEDYFVPTQRLFWGVLFSWGEIEKFFAPFLSKFPLEMTHPVLKLVHFCSTCASAFFHSVCFYCAACRKVEVFCHPEFYFLHISLLSSLCPFACRQLWNFYILSFTEKIFGYLP